MNCNIQAKGFCEIYDADTNTYLQTEFNELHKQNLSVAIVRALANMQNGNVYQMAFGLGGTTNTPNVTNWNGTQYNEVYNEIVDASSALHGSGEGSMPSLDDPSVLFVSGPGCRIEETTNGARLIVECMLNRAEPVSQDADVNNNPYYTIKEISLFTSGCSINSRAGYQDIQFPANNNVIARFVSDSSGLNTNTQYGFTIAVDGSIPQEITFVTGNTSPTVQDIINIINSSFAAYNIAANCEGSDLSNTTSGRSTFGALRIYSGSLGDNSSIVIAPPTTQGIQYLVNALSGTLLVPINGTNAGVRLSSGTPEQEARRMLSHLILNTPIVKAATRSYRFKYVIDFTIQ